MIRKIIYIILIMSVLACAKSQIIGKWRGVNLTQNGQLITENINKINFTLDANGGYQYQAADGYTERGTYRIVGKSLFITDTLNKIAEKKVHIQSINSSQMSLLMKTLKQEEQVLTFEK